MPSDNGTMLGVGFMAGVCQSFYPFWCGYFLHQLICRTHSHVASGFLSRNCSELDITTDSVGSRVELIQLIGASEGQGNL